MSRLPPGLARRIDRLARRAHAFHRLAHHPLCGAYRGELLRLGRRTRLCLGCSLLGLGGALGLAAGLLAPRPSGAALAAGAALLLLAAWGSLRPGAGGRARKLLTRLAPMGLAAALAAGGLRRADGPGLLAALLAAAAFAGALLAYRRRGPDRSPCATCPERPAGPACAGFRPAVRRERAFSRLAGRWIAAASAPPRSPAS
ncbi:MAG: hypothetical protein HZB56_03335 [Deltaproteobacteria bacterium]|nr:hypothetical protein [Deltaproteobacteria bacterium]